MNYFKAAKVVGVKKSFHFLILFGCLLWFVPGISQPRISAASDEVAEDTLLDAFFQKLHERGMFNGAVAVKQNGKLILKKGYGKANFSYNRDFTPETPMEIASVSKQFTAAAIMILQQQGKLNTADEAQRYLGRDFPYPQITIQHLLTHTSGLPDYEKYFRQHWDTTKIAYNKDILDYFKKEKPALRSTPGEKYSYSNSGYVMLAEIVRAVSGQPLDAFLSDHIFKPAGMLSTAFYERDSIWKIEDYAPGYMPDARTGRYARPEDLPGKSYYHFLSGRLGSGRLSSSINDLIKWDSLLYRNTILTEKSKQQIFRVYMPEKDTSDYGFGWHIYEDEQLGKVVYHTGSWAGNLSFIKRFTDDKSLIIMLNNTYDKNYMKEIRDRVVGYLKGDPLDVPTQKLDYLIKGGLVFDGTQNKPIKTDIGITGNRISYIGDSGAEELKAEHTIHAEGLYVSPGFIDPHTHNDRWLNSPDELTRRNLPSLAQGVTTVFIGNDGAGTFDLAEEFKKYETDGIGTNVAAFVGLSPVREAVLGKDDVAPDKKQLNRMKGLVAKAMKEGAFGLSTGLYYAPQTYASTEEVVALAKVAAEYGGIYDTHMRSESNDLAAAVKETIEIGRAAGIALMISHIKALGPAAWGKSEEVIKIIEDAQKEGISVFANQYPYTASHTSLKAMTIPAWAQAGGDEKMIGRVKNADAKLMNEIGKNLALRGGDSRIQFSFTKDSSLVGKTLHQVAAGWNASPEKAIIKLLTDASATMAVSYSMDETDVDNFMQCPWVLTGSDGGGRHPRAYGAFARKIRAYGLEEKKMPLEAIIYSATGHTATLLGLQDRGFIRENYAADIVIFDPAKIKDEATFEQPELLATGVNYVFVNGVLSIKDGQPAEVWAGRPLRHVPSVTE